LRANKGQFAGPGKGAEFAESFMAIGKGQAAEIAQEAEGAMLGRAITSAEARIGEAAVAVVEKLATEPNADGARNFPFSAKKMGKFVQDEVGIDPGLGLEISGIILAFDGAFAFMEEKRGLDTMGNFLDEGNERGDVAFIEDLARIVGLKLGDDGARVKDGDVERIAGLAEKGATARREMGRAFAGHLIEEGATAFADETRFEVDRDGGVGALQQHLDFAQQGHGRFRWGG
jgi:hypothetical protein